MARRAGEPERAESYIKESLRHFKRKDYQVGTMMALGDLGDLARDRRDWKQARALYQEALAIGRANPSKRIVIEVIESVAIVAAHTGQLHRGAMLLGATESLRERIGLRYRHPESRVAVEKALVAIRSRLASRQIDAAWSHGQNLSEEDVMAEALDEREVATGAAKPLLTGREHEILLLLSTGMTDPEIADALFISVRTVEHHVSRLFRKLDVHTRTAATSAAVAAGLVVPGDSRTLI